MASRKISGHLLHVKFFSMLLLLTSNHADFLVQFGIIKKKNSLVQINSKLIEKIRLITCTNTLHVENFYICLFLIN